MKSIYLCHYKEQSGTGRAAQGYIEALKTIGEVAVRSIDLQKSNLPKREEEQVSLEGADYLFHHLVPHMIQYRGPYKNIGVRIKETVGYTKYDRYLEPMDEIITPSFTFMENGDKFVPHATDISIYDRVYPQMNIPDAKGRFKFYTVAEFNRRKNVWDLLKVYYSSFLPSDPVHLILKLHSFRLSPADLRAKISDICQSIAEGLKLYKYFEDYPPITIITDYWNDDQICSLHKYGDCFVSTSFGEAFSYPECDAVLFNNHVIGTGSCLDYFGCYDKRIKHYRGELVPCFANMDTYDDYNTCREMWFSPNIFRMRTAMRQVVHMDKPDNTALRELVSYKKVGEILSANI